MFFNCPILILQTCAHTDQGREEIDHGCVQIDNGCIEIDHSRVKIVSNSS